MNRKVLVAVVVGVAVLLAVGVVLVLRPAQQPPQAPPAPARIPQTPPVAEKTGTAADLVPADCAFFATMLRGGEVYDLVAGSNAVGALLDMPLVQQQLARVKESPPYQQMMTILEEKPLAQAGLAAAKDAFRQEVFVYGGREWVPVLANLLELNRLAQVSQFRAGLLSGMGLVPPEQPNPVAAILPEVLAHADQLFVPPIVIGFRITASREQVTQLLQALVEWVNAQPDFPGEVEKVTIGEGDYYTLKLTAGELIPVDALGQMRLALEQAGVSQPQTESFLRWLTAQTASVTMGFFRSYAIVSIGRDNSHLEELGAANPLGTAEVLTPARKFVGERLVSLDYVSKELAAACGFQVDALKKMAEGVLEALPAEKMPEGLVQRLRADIGELAADIGGSLPEPGERISVAFLNRGIESYVFSRQGATALDYSRPLSILARAGGEPILLWAVRSPSSIPAYEAVRTWAQRAYGYVDDFVVPTLHDSDLKEFEEVRAVFIPFIEAVDKTTREKLLPSIDAGESLLLLDAGLRLKQLFLEKPFPRVMPMLEPALVIELKDSQAFVEAVGEYLKAVDEMVMRFRQAQSPDGRAEPFRVPRPSSLPFAGGRMYFYQLPMPLDPAIMLHAAVTDDLLILSASPAQSERIVAAGGRLSDPVVDLTGAAGSVARLRTDELFSAARQWAELLLSDEMGLVAMEPEQRQFLLSQLETAWKVVGTFKGMTSRTYRDGPYVVGHSWIEFVDVADGNRGGPTPPRGPRPD